MSAVDRALGWRLCGYHSGWADFQRARHIAPDAIEATAFSPDGKTLAMGCSDGTVYLWNVSTGLEMGRLKSRPGRLLKLKFSADGRQLAAVGRSEGEGMASEDAPSSDELPATLQKEVITATIWSGTSD